MNKLFTFCAALFTVLLTGIHFVSAQEATASPDTDWQVIEQCVGEPAKPPLDWHYDGTILFGGKYGIYGMRTNWETPRVLSFNHITNNGTDIDMGTGSFSPDKTHFATPIGDSACGSIHCTGTLNEVYSIVVFDVTGSQPRQHKIYPLHITYDQMSGEFDEPYVFWLNDHQIIYPVFPPGEYASSNPILTDITTGQQTELSKDSNLICWRCSPDHSRQLISTFQGTYEDRKSIKELRTFPENEVLEPIEEVILPAYIQSWSTDSQHFIAIQLYGDDQAYIAEYDRDGKRLGQISPRVTQSQIFTNSRWDILSWSPNTNYIMLGLGSIGIDQGYTELNGYNYLIDIPEHKAYHLCNDVDFIHWSPDSRYFAFADDADLLVYDVAAQTTYKVFSYPKDDNYLYVLDWRAN
jgi:hypothetical protein